MNELACKDKEHTIIIEVLKLCREIKPFKSSSIHQLSSKVLKDAFLVISTQLTHLFNLIFKTGVYPDIWKRANVIPLFKGGDLTNVNNYRPISLLPLPGKIIEKMIHSQINNFLDDNHLLNSKQDGFRKGRSTIDTIAGFTDDIYSEMDKGNCSVAVFIDFRKAFDVVDHNILVKKLSYMGIRGNNLNLLTNYLRNRSQCTLANSVTSQPCSMTYGVPQGITLGPLQFLIYINDLYKSTTTSKMRLYADDTVLYTHSNSSYLAPANLQYDLTKLIPWCNKNKPTINASKTKTMLFGTRRFTKKQDYLLLQIENNILDKELSFKYLGVILDGELKFNLHAAVVYKIASYKMNVLRRIRPYINEPTALQIYKAKIQPYIDYGDIFYMSANADKLDDIQSYNIGNLESVSMLQD